jgi:hypothetical protein
MAGYLHRLGQYLARCQPVGGVLQVSQESLVINAPQTILPLPRDILVADGVIIAALSVCLES